ncbi:hypothetical protein Ngar_c30050 [Candidatus Nitrososphaera gargensis Ga9.2]|uniref:Uncharacterized protein n=1 Tax=Nitrososphaera gargensis (strain Ga9.2) TaxID=1237085 RepID=K0IKR4_NITGG|nr:hypothetical protein [Candidatus Nitrososphaera gargensis]AFU59923.1 hypothetical protein Ngar_c30050 [Candidatus Nitrososphaera gargensis Ga9.2]
MTQLRTHIDNANSALEEDDTQAAMGHIVLALEEIEMILGGNVTWTANATDTETAAAMGNATAMTDDTEMNSTARESDDTETQMMP